MIVSPIAEKLAADVASPITGGAAAGSPGGDTTAPTITSASSASVAENSPFSMTLTANESVTWAIVGGADAALFSLAGSTLSMTAKDFEAPADADTGNTYVVQVRATDGSGNQSTQTITVTVTDVDEVAPTITSSASHSVTEGTAFTTTLTANEAVTWSKVGGADQALFTLSGATLSMTAKSFAAPTDADTNNTYIVTVRATDAAGNTADQTITVSVAFSPVSLFGPSDKGGLYDASVLSSLWQDTGRTVPAGVNDPVRVMDDLSGKGNHVVAPSDTARPILKVDAGKYYLDFDGIDDELRWSDAGLDISRNVAGITTSAAYQFKSATASTGWIMSQTATAATTVRAGMSRNSGGTLLVAGGRRRNADSFAFVSTGNTTAVQVSTSIFDYAASDLFLRRAGAQVASSTSFQTDGTTDDVRAFSGGIGSTGIGTGFLDMKFYAGPYIGRKLTSTEIGNLETWLSAKNGAPVT